MRYTPDPYSASVTKYEFRLTLTSKRQSNVHAALEKIIEQAGEVSVNAAAVVSAVQAYAKINSQGHWVERRETVNLNELFGRMTRDELEAYAQNGTLPAWFPAGVEQEVNQDEP